MSRKAKTLTLTNEERGQLTQIDERGSDWRELRRAPYGERGRYFSLIRN